jgi:hypothetical protein
MVMQNTTLLEKMSVSLFRPAFLVADIVFLPFFRHLHSTYLSKGLASSIFVFLSAFVCFSHISLILFALALAFSIPLMFHNIFLLRRIQIEDSLYKQTVLAFTHIIEAKQEEKLSLRSLPSLQKLREITTVELSTKFHIDPKNPLETMQKLYLHIHATEQKISLVTKKGSFALLKKRISHLRPGNLWSWLTLKHTHPFDWLCNSLYFEPKIKEICQQIEGLFAQYEETLHQSKCIDWNTQLQDPYWNFAKIPEQDKKNTFYQYAYASYNEAPLPLDKENSQELQNTVDFFYKKEQKTPAEWDIFLQALCLNLRNCLLKEPLSFVFSDEDAKKQLQKFEDLITQSSKIKDSFLEDKKLFPTPFATHFGIQDAFPPRLTHFCSLIEDLKKEMEPI